MAKKKSKPKTAKATNPSKPLTITDAIDATVIAALSSLNQPVLMKVCRLCESKDGPFLNIFDADKVTAKKIDDLMPFGIAENDDLPHKICFRCSAKVEELHEFIQKCIKTQENLRIAMGKKGPLVTKTKTRTIWEEKLNKSNMSNDDICDALIKKAMEGIKGIPLNPVPLDEKPPSSSKKQTAAAETPVVPVPVDSKNGDKSDESDQDVPLIKKAKSKIEKCDQKMSQPTRSSRSKNIEPLLDGLEGGEYTRKPPNKQTVNSNKKSENLTTALSMDYKNNSDDDESDEKNKGNEKAKQDDVKKDTKPFNIMDHVSMIKVTGVGVLFQCKLCNRNFLNKEVVESHGCAKNGVPKVDFTKNLPPPELPKPPTVKYINTKTSNIISKPVENNKIAVENELVKVKVPESKPKPRIGPASKVKRVNESNIIGTVVTPREASPPPPKPLSVSMPSAPSLNSRYKLVPGPNNTFTLVEEPANKSEPSPVKEDVETNQPSRKRKNEVATKTTEVKPKDRKHATDNGIETAMKSKGSKKASSPMVIDLDDTEVPDVPLTTPSQQQPYPVGLFQTVPHHSNDYVPQAAPDVPAFTTPAMKKQSYTIVQTGHPSKLLISTKHLPAAEEVPKKRPKKVKEVREEPAQKQPFSVTLEDNAPPKEAGFFTFINVDPLLQPSYVLPTDNIIQESQITTSTPVVRGAAESKEKDKDKYSCNMCGERFSREKKLLAHIQSHYTKMDEEDQQRIDKTSKKRGRKS